jgi:hypothetical protein
MNSDRLSSSLKPRPKRQLRISVQIGSGSSWRARLIGVAVLCFLQLLIFGLWLAVSLSLVVIAIAALLRMFLPKRGPTKTIDGEWSVMSDAPSLDAESRRPADFNLRDGRRPLERPSGEADE